MIDLKSSVDPPRPKVALIGKSVLPSPTSSDSNIALSNPDELPQDATLTFSVQSQIPAAFSHDETIEVATAEESFSTTLSLANGAITLENSKVAVVTLDPAKSFGPSAFGQLQYRVTANGVAGDWRPLATLVRLPVLKVLECPSTAELACRLSGSNLFLVDSVSSDAQFTHPVQVPDGFPGYAMPVPHPVGAELYVRLRDDPSVVSRATLAAQPLPPSPEESARAVARQAAARAAIEAAFNSDRGQPTATNSTQTPPAQGDGSRTRGSTITAPAIGVRPCTGRPSGRPGDGPGGSPKRAPMGDVMALDRTPERAHVPAVLQTGAVQLSAAANLLKNSI